MGRMKNPDSSECIVFASYRVLRLRSASRRVHPRCSARRAGHGFARWRRQPYVLERPSAIPGAFLSTFISRGLIRASLAAGCRSRATRWAASSRASPASPLTSSYPCLIPASRLRSAMLKRRTSLSASRPHPQSLPRRPNVYRSPNSASATSASASGYNPVHNLLAGKRVILIGDSIIPQHDQPRNIVRIVRGAGATEVHLRISCAPPSRRACYGVQSTPSKRRTSSPPITLSKKFAEFIEADSLAYLSLEGLLHSVQGEQNSGYCTACYTGNYPTQWVDVEDPPRRGIDLRRLRSWALGSAVTQFALRSSRSTSRKTGPPKRTQLDRSVRSSRRMPVSVMDCRRFSECVPGPRPIDWAVLVD